MLNLLKNPGIEKIDKKRVYYFEFEGCRYYPKTAKLVVDGTEIFLSKYEREILELLISRQGEHISRQEIIDILWKDSPCNLNTFGKRIDKLRDFVGDRGLDKDLQMIQSSARNYLFFRPKVTPHYYGLAPSQRSLIKGGVLSSLLTVSLIIGFSGAFKSETFEAVEPKLLTSWKAGSKRPVASPDGKVIVYSRQAQNSSTWDLTVTLRHSKTHKKLTNETRAYTQNTEPGFSPSGKQIAWVRSDYRTFCEVITIDFDTTSLKTSDKKTVYRCKPSQLVRTPQWLSETSLLLSSRLGVEPFQVVKLNLWTEEDTFITEPNDTYYGDYNIYYHTESQRMAYLRQSTGIGSELRVYDFTTKTDQLIKSYEHPLYSIAWLNKDQLVAQSDESYEIVNIIDGNVKSTPVVFQEVEQLQYVFAIDERTIGFVRGPTMDREVVLHDLNNNTTNDMLVTVFDEYQGVVVKGKNNSIVFSLVENLQHHLYYRVGDRVTKIAELPRNGRVLDMAVSPDGELIAYLLSSTIFIKNRKGEILHSLSGVTKGFTFSSDSRHLVVSQKNEQGTSLLNLSVFEDFEAKEITNGFLPKADQDGTLYFLRKIDDQDWLFRQTDAGVEKILPAPFSTVQFHSNLYDVINHSLFYIENDNLTRLDLNSDEKTVIKKVKGDHFSMNYAQDFMVSVHTVTAQNNLIEFKLKHSDDPE
ncbi:winged helix-turn-helix domain-containing protein [Aliikangiella coralliicola]|uniref:OmpR/PhoB-type domain-containing protein n=1 Tax=Aliikangiella coralliicola TaxID=2592383 RepID=A0A545UJE0_9GAMM|nr:winged helix-turn-helix domain-containing protein [Aliikangiella coralliicola]TQV89553.1 hypothetical protein FLL46_01325 [Aliikangiella coralliicola]